MYIHNLRKIKYIMIWCLIWCLITGGPMSYALASNYDSEAVFLNDRSADIAASLPLQTAGLAVPGGLSGDGVIVGLADSGLDKGGLNDIHPDLQNDIGRMPRVAMIKSYAGREMPDDPVGHGTHMAATIAGSGAASNGQYQGIAPRASLYFQALLDQGGSIKLPAQLDDLFGPAYSAGVRIHVNGWGEGTNQYGSYSGQIDDFVYTHPDFLPVFGSGNNGPAQGSLNNEANSKNALIVGSSQIPRPVFSPEAHDATQVADSSSRGPAAGGRNKPDLLAPGSAVISACSSLTDSNFAANPAYTEMGGTSMAAAVTGGAAALLEEYLREVQGIKTPSSALIKALLINGARDLEKSSAGASGFGTLDLANTILPLREGSSLITVNRGNLVDGITVEQVFHVYDSRQPFDSTLAWIDSPGADGNPTASLVDNLDLEIICPDGQVLKGNDFKRLGISDSTNNVEKVSIDNPLPGDYIVRIHGTGLEGPVWPSHYALVYGQTMRHEIVREVHSNNQISTASGQTINLSDYSVKGSSNGKSFSSPAEIKAGCDLYLGKDKVYAFQRSLDSGGAQILEEEHGSLLVEMNPTSRQGGTYLSEHLLKSTGQLLLNGIPVQQIKDIPVGVKINASVNPGLQNIWTLSAIGEQVEGFIETVDPEKKQLRLVKDQLDYSFSSWTALSSLDTLVYGSYSDAPYGSLSTVNLASLSPGMKVSMMVSSPDHEVQYIKVERSVVVGTINDIDLKTDRITIDDGRNYQIFPGIQIQKDGQACELKDLKTGDKVSGALLGNTDKLIELKSFSNIMYGRVIYFNPALGVLYLYDDNEQFRVLYFGTDTRIFSGGLLSSRSAIAPGEWLRLILDGNSEKIIQADTAKILEQDAVKTFQAYDSEKNIITMSDGSAYIFSESCQMTKGGYSMTPDLLKIGETVTINTLAAPEPWSEFLARVEVSYDAAIPAPELEVSASNYNNVLVIRGSSSADRIVITREDGSRDIVSVNNDGSFGRLYTMHPHENNVKVLALDSRTGGISGQELEVESSSESGPQTRTFFDIYSDPDRQSIENLASSKIIAGYGDGTFRPGAAVNRAEFLTMLGRAGAWKIEDTRKVEYFTDNGSIPIWAWGAVYYARQKGIVNGYPDGSFKPRQSMTRSAMVVMLASVLSASPGQPGKINSYTDIDDIPAWAMPAYSYFYSRGWLNWFGGDTLEPEKELTRGEAARFIDHLMPATDND